jgi:hypothetical protein
MKNLQIDIKIKLQINDTILELSKDDAETLYNTLGNALNKTSNPYPSYPWITNPVPYKITGGTGSGGTGELPYYPPGVRSMDPTCTCSIP